MASIDQLQIEIQAQDKASATLNDLYQSMENLGRALERLDASKVTSFARAMDKLSGIGANTNVTTKGIKDLANELSNSFGIRTKKGVDDLKKSITALYEVNKQQKQGFDTGDAYDSAIKGVQNAIEANYKYKVSLDETTKSVKDYVDATNKSGAKIGMADMKQEFGENFKEMASVLGGSFKNDLDSAKEGVQDLAEYLSEMNNQLGTNFDTQNVEKGFSDLVETVRNAKEVILDYKEASKQGIISDSDVFDGVVTAIERVNELYREQEKYGATNGLGGIVGVLNQLGNINLPDLNSFVSAAKDIGTNAPQVQEVSQSVKNIGDAATQATTQVEGLNDALRQSHIVIEGNERVEHGFTMKDAPQYQNVEYPPMVVEQAQAFEEKLLPAIIDTENEISNLYQHMMSLSGVEAAYDAITEKFVEWKTQLMEMNGAISGDKWIVPEFSGNADFSRQQVGWISNIKPEVVEGYFYEIEDAANKCLPAIQNIGTTALALPDQFKTSSDYINQCLETMKGDVQGVGQAVPDSFGKVEQGAKSAASDIEKATQAAREFKKVISDMESGKIDFDKDKFDAAVKGYEQASEAIKNYKNALLGVEEKQAKKTEVAKPAEMGNVLENIIALGEAFESLGSKLNAVGDKGIKLFKTLTTPLRMAANEYKEKFEHMGEVVSDFQKNFRVHMDKIAQFWKRTMKTFTFMLVRKAITAIIKEVGNAVQSLAMYSNAMGTAFNTDISNMIADFQYLGRSIVSVFAPLLNIIAPIIDAIVSKIATLLSYIGMIIAALGGKATFTKAKKNVDNYADSLDGASKSAKNLTMGIDELNILSDQKSGSSKPYDGFEDAWEDVDIPNKIKDLANWLKGLWDDFFFPIKEAWERAKQYVIDGFKTMVDSLKRLLGHIWDDFITMWHQEETIHMFEQIFRIVGDIFRVVRNLANAFDEAWQKGKVGLKIFENLRDIAAILVEHARNVTYYMIGWAEGIDFYPLLKSFERLTNSLKKAADFIGGVFEDMMKNGVLKYIEFLIEKGIPDLQNTLTKVLDTFNFTALRVKLNKLWEAFEELFENLHEGVTETIGNLGEMVARFTNSQTFTDFLQRLVDITKLITAERVEKVLTGLGKGILDIAESVIKFINSDAFMKFLEVIADWIDNHSVDQIAGILTNIANAILIFKFGAFAAEKLSGLFTFFTVIKGLTNLGAIAQGITNLGTSLGVAGESATTAATGGSKLISLSGGFSGLITVVGGVVAAFLEFKGVSDAVKNLATVINGGEGSLVWSLAELAASVLIPGAALTALLGVPAGLIATGVVGSIAALKGLNDYINQMNFDQVTNAIMTHGDTTVQMVNEWYTQATSTVTEHTNKWKEVERNLTQDRRDLEEYSRTLDTLEAAFRGVGQASSDTADRLARKYSDLTGAIDHYIDDTYNSLMQDLEDNRAYYEAKGVNVDAWIGQLNEKAEAEKRVYHETQEAVDAAQQAYDEAVNNFGESSTEAKNAYHDLELAYEAHQQAIEGWRRQIDAIDTSGAVEQIANLGNSLDFSQYNGDWNQAALDIRGGLDEIKSSYEQGMEDVNRTFAEKIRENDRQYLEGFISPALHAQKRQQIEEEAARDRDTLVNSTKEGLDFYSRSLVTNLDTVAATAEQKWDETNPFIRFFTMGTDKDAYIYQQMQTYVDQHLGETGITGMLKEAYSVLPENLQSSAVESMTRVVDESAAAYFQAAHDNESYVTEITQGSYQNVLNAVPGMLDYITPASGITTQFSQAYDNSLGDIDYDTSAFRLNHQYGESITANSTAMTDPAAEVAKEAAQTIDTTMSETIVEQTSLPEAMETYGKTSGEGLGTGMASGIDSVYETVRTSINNWAEFMRDALHDNPFIPWGSPNKQTHIYGEELVYGMNEGIDAVRNTTQAALDAWFAFIRGTITNQMRTVRELFNTTISSIFSGEGLDVETPISTLFTNITTAITYQLEVLGATLTELMATFFETYILPYFSNDIWQPLFDLLHEETIVPNWENFLVWFDEEAMAVWWEDHMLPWVEAGLWDEQIYTPIRQNMRDIHWKAFITWWDTSIKDWWTNHLLKPWCQNSKWDTDIYNPIKKNMRDVHWKDFIKWWDEVIKDWWENHLLRPWAQTNKWDTDIYTPIKRNMRDVHWKDFMSWWDDSIKNWWNEHFVHPYATDEKWNNDVYTPIKTNMRDVHWKDFLQWWDNTLRDWWNNHFMPWVNLFKLTIAETYDYLLKLTQVVFTAVKDIMIENINTAKDSVVEACAEMADAVREVIALIEELLRLAQEAMSLGIDIGGFAEGGFVSAGDLFIANEAGAELIGTIGGHTAVASNQEITGIADAVYSTGNQESQLLNELININRQILDKEQVVIGDKDIARMANDGQDQLGMVIIS